MHPEHDPHGDSNGWLFLSLGLSMLGLVFGLAVATRIMGPPAILAWGAAFVALTVIANGPVGKAIARRISGEVSEPKQSGELSEEVYAELDELRARMAEMEERQDFSERLLANRVDESVEPGRGGIA
jgi:hypothetical protein